MKKYNILLCILVAALCIATCKESPKSEETQDIETTRNEETPSDTLSNETSSSHAGSVEKNSTNQYQQNSTNTSTSSEKDSNVIFGVEGTGGSDNDARTKDIRENQGRPY